MCIRDSHNTIAKAYRKDAIARGLLVTLKEKSIQQPSLDELIGACFLHKGIQTHVQPQSRFYDAKKPDRYESLTTFATRRQEMIEWKQLGVNKLYLHLDGWAEPKMEAYIAKKQKLENEQSK